MSSSTHVDARGVQRRNCSLCSCDQYNGGTKGMKCLDCGHPPGKHLHFKKPTSTDSKGNLPIYATSSIAPTASSVSTMDTAMDTTMDTTMDTISQSQPSLKLVDTSWNTIKTNIDGLCQFPGCSNPASFDLNSGEQDEFCSEHIGASPSLSISPPAPALKPLPSPIKSIFPLFSRRAKQSQPRPRPRPVTTGSVNFRPQILPSTQPTASAVPPDQQCKLSGCTKKKFTEANGHIHDFCGRRHAREYEKQNSQVPLELQCKTPGCCKQKHQNPKGGYFDYCSMYCRDNGGEPVLASASAPNIALAAIPTHGACQYPGCPKPKYFDPGNGRVHDFCGRTHAYQARIQGISGDTVSIRVATSQEKSTIVGKFTKTWASKKGHCPPVSFVFMITNSKLTQRWTAYRSTLQNNVVEEYYHGTKMTCNITVNSVLCTHPNCGVCGISSTGFDRRCIRNNINFQRFGHGFYLAPNSSKCHDYTQGSYTYRAMLLVDVCPGNKYNLKKGDQSLTGPPQGFDSVYGRTGADLNYEELVVYNPDATLPKCIIVYQKGGEGKIAT